MSRPKKSRRYGVDVLSIKLVKLAVVINQDDRLHGLLGNGVVTYAVMREVVKDFESEKAARGRDVGVPIENGAIDDFDVVFVSARRRRFRQLRGLKRSEGGRDLDDFELGPVVDFWVEIANVVEDVEHHGSVPGADLVDDEVVVGVIGELVVGDEVTGDSLAIIGAEELGWRMP